MTNILSGLQSFGELSATESISGERASFHSSLCRVESGPPDQGYWAPGVAALTGLDRGTVPPAAFCHGSKSSGDMLAGQGGADHPCSEGGGCQEDGGDADGGGDEEGQESQVDGVLGKPRLGKERRVPQDATPCGPNPKLAKSCRYFFGPFISNSECLRTCPPKQCKAQIKDDLFSHYNSFTNIRENINFANNMSQTLPSKIYLMSANADNYKWRIGFLYIKVCAPHNFVRTQDICLDY